MGGAVAFGEDARGDAGGGFLCGLGSSGDVFRGGGRLRSSLDAEKLDVEDEQSARAPTTGFFTVSEVGWNPKAALFALDHELEALGPAFDHAVKREACGLAALDGAVEEFAVGRPA